MFEPWPRKEMPPRQLGRAEFAARFRGQFPGDAFSTLQAELDRITEAAWAEYDAGNKAPRTRKAGPGFADPDYDLAVDWLEARAAIDRAAERHRDPSARRAFSS